MSRRKLELPVPKKFTLTAIGPGIVLVAMGLGSGEFILWPFLVAQFGFGIIWGALLGVTFQYFVSNESGRYTLSTGASVYTAFAKLWKYFPIWFILSTYLSFGFPGIIGSGGQILGYAIDFEKHQYLTVGMLLVIGLILTFGGKVYNNLERFQKLVIGISIPILCVIAALLFDIDIFISMIKGLFGFGEGFFGLPAGISLITFLGAVAYSGAAGNLTLSHSFYIQDKGLGMAKHVDSQVDLKSNKKEIPAGLKFMDTESNVKKFNKWFRYVALEQFISFWIIGMFTILLLMYIAYALVYPDAEAGGLQFIFDQSEMLALDVSQTLKFFFLGIGVLFLFKTQLGVYETTSRIMAENTSLFSEKIRKKYPRKTIYFGFLWLQIATAIAISLAAVTEPVQILIISTFFSAISMLVISIAVFWLNSSKLINSRIKPTFLRQAIVMGSILTYGILVAVTVVDLAKKYF